MELITILRALWRRKLLVIIGLVVSVGVGAAIMVKSRRYNVGVAVAHVLVDTHRSTIADLGSDPTNGVSPRAYLLATLLASAPVEETIAKQAGIPSDRLVVVPPNPATAVPTNLQVNASTVGPPQQKYELTVGTDSTLPLITLSAQAPTSLDAARLANAGVTALQQYVSSTAAAQQIPQRQQTVVRPLGSAIAGVSSRGFRRLYAAVIAVMLFVLLCGAIVVIPRAARLWREAGDVERDATRARGLDLNESEHWEHDLNPVNSHVNGAANGSGQPASIDQSDVHRVTHDPRRPVRPGGGFALEHGAQYQVTYSTASKPPRGLRGLVNRSRGR